MKLIKPGDSRGTVRQAASNGHGGQPGPMAPAGNPEALQAALDAVTAARNIEGADQAARINGLITAAAGASPPLTRAEVSILRAAIGKRPPLIRLADFDKDFREAQPDRGGPHRVNMKDDGFTYSSGLAECCQRCADRGAKLFYDGDFLADLPIIVARAITGPRHGSETQYLLAPGKGARPRLVDWHSVDSGEWADFLDMFRPSGTQETKALATTIRQIAHSDAGIPVESATVNPRDRVKDGPLKGHLPQPSRDTTPLGYFEIPEDIDESEQEGYRQALISLAAKCPRIALFMGASAGAPFTATGLRVQRHIWDAYGEPRNGKTTALTAAGSIWGDPRLAAESGLIMPANATSLGVLRHAGMLGILPTFMDEIAAGDWTPDGRVRFGMSMAQGGTRTRAPRQGHGEDVTPPCNSIVFVTGNEAFTSGLGAGNTAGVIPRTVEIPAPFTPDAETADMIEEAAKSSFGYFGPRILDIITPDEFRDGALGIEGVLPGSGGGERGTLVRHIAQALMGARVLDSIAEPGEPIPGALETAARIAALDYLGEHSERDSDGITALDRIHEIIVTEPSRWPTEEQFKGGIGGPIPPGGPSRNFLGFRDGDYFYILPATWDQVIKDTGISGLTALRELLGSGALEVPPSQQSGSNKRWKVRGPSWAGRPQCYRVGRTHIERDDGGGPDPAPEVPPVQPELPADPAPLAPDIAARAPAGPAPDVPPAFAESLEARREDWINQARQRNHVRTAAQADTLRAALIAIDGGGKPRTLAALEGRGNESGAFAPRLRKAPQHPFWSYQGWDGPMNNDRGGRFISCESYNYQAPYDGPVITLDRNSAFVSAISSVIVCPDALERTGPLDLDNMGTVKPGLYLMQAYSWTEPGLPNPFPGAIEPGGYYWITSPIAGLLAGLAKAGRWPDASALDSLTGQRTTRLDKWAHYIAEVRGYALTHYGRGSGEYEAQKLAYSITVSALMRGTRENGRLIHKSKCTRRDWSEAIRAQNGVTLWRAADRMGGAVKVGGIDSMDIPADRAKAAIKAGTIRIDDTGLILGTWHIKGGKD